MEERNEEHRVPDRLDELRLMRFLDGRLDSGEQAEVQGHLQQSAEDRRTLDALREESRLLREAAENLSEPPVKIGEKVLAVLRVEHRRRMSLERARRFRNRLFSLTAAAALLMIGLYFLAPHGESARMLSGTGASVARLGVLQPLPKGGRLFDEDVLITGRGQFVRLSLTSGLQVDADEDSRLRIEKGAASLVYLESGRARFSTTGLKNGAMVRTNCGQVHAERNSEFEVWLATPCEARWPEWTEAWTAGESEPRTADPLVCVTVFKGRAVIQTGEVAQGHPVEAGGRVTFTASQLPVSSLELVDWEALDSRREPWHAMDGASPSGLALLGLYPPFSWKDLGEELGLLSSEVPGGANVAAKLKDAFEKLATAETQVDPTLRALQFGQGQQALRTAALGLPLSSDLCLLGRVVEGLAHSERGRCLLSVGTNQSREEAAEAFRAAGVAFGEALDGGKTEDSAPGLGTLATPRLSVLSRLRELKPDEQGLLLARFYLPWVLEARRQLKKDDAPKPVSPLFEQAASLLDSSVEGLAARYGRARALAVEGQPNQALAVLAKLKSYSVAGLPDAVRAEVEGLRQAAHVAAARIHAERGEWDQVRKVVDAFQTRYPLSMDDPAAKQLERISAGAPKPAATQPPARPQETPLMAP